MSSYDRIYKALNPTIISQVLALLSALLYTVGLIVVNVHLASFGVQDFKLFKFRYITAGWLVLITLAVFTLLAGRRIYHAESDFVAITKLGIKQRYGILWIVFSLIQVLVEIMFGIVVAVCWIGSLLFEGASITPVFVIITVFFVVDYTLFIGGLYKQKPKLTILIAFLFHCTSIVLFLHFVDHPALRSLFWAFVILSVFLNLIFDLRKRLVHSLSYKFVESVWMLIVLFVFAIYFGSNLYSMTRIGIGGGKPPVVQLLLTDEGLAKLKDLLITRGALSEKVLLLSENSQEVIIMPANSYNKPHSTLRIRKTFVLGIVTSDDSSHSNVCTPDDRETRSYTRR